MGFTVPADTLRQAMITAMFLMLATGRHVYALAVLPTDVFHRRVDAAPMPSLLRVPQAAEMLGVSRQAALPQASGRKLPRSATRGGCCAPPSPTGPPLRQVGQRRQRSWATCDRRP